jgi:outer membrane translocation and assembly module TamA
VRCLCLTAQCYRCCVATQRAHKCAHVFHDPTQCVTAWFLVVVSIGSNALGLLRFRRSAAPTVLCTSGIAQRQTETTISLRPFVAVKVLRNAACVRRTLFAASLLLLGAAGLTGCAARIPPTRYGVNSFDLEGTDKIDDAAIKACLATHEHERAGFTLGPSEDPQCGVPPFDENRIPLKLWAWPWTEWPLYDDAVFTRDIDRIERFYRARGYYQAHVAGVQQEKDEEDREIDLRVQVEENQPVLVQQIDVVGLEDVDQPTHRRVDRAQRLTVGDPFDEAYYDESKSAIRAALREASYARAEVDGSIVIDPIARTARVQYRVKPGPASKFGQLKISGQEDLSPTPIWGAAAIEENTPFRPSVLEDAKRAIYELGPFASVEVVELPRKDEPVIDILIKVIPGRRFRFGVGAGLQVGTDVSYFTSYVDSDVNYWDLHLLGKIEHRDFLGGMRRLSIEDRPRLIFDAPFPRTPKPSLGNLLLIEFRQPAFAEARTSLVLTGRWDLGPDPYGGKFFRSDLVAGIGPERTFFRGKVSWSSTLNLNLFIPHNADENEPYPAYYAAYVQHAITLDLRNDPRATRRGAYFGLNVQHAGYFLPSDWDYVRIVPEARGYVPLPLGMVLAGRLRIGVMEITNSSIRVPSNDEFGYRARLRQLGPLRNRLREGGSNSVRGYASNTVGDVTQIANRLDSGGTRSWQTSLELRIPVTASIGAVLFVDAGDVSREKRFRLNEPQTTLGFGLRYKTIVGPIRFDVGFAPSGLQSIGRDRRQRNGFDIEADPAPFPESTFFGTPGAWHFTIGEAF